MAKRKKIGDNDYTPLILLAVIAAGGYYLYKMISNNDNSKNNANLAAGVAATTASSISAAEAAGISQQLSDSQLQTIADTVFRDGMKQKGNAATADQDDIVYQLSLPGNLVDLLKVVQDFGVKYVDNSGILPTLCSEFGVNCPSIDMGAFLHAVLDSDHLDQVNQNLSGNGISYAF